MVESQVRDICYIKVSHVYCEIHRADATTEIVRVSLKELEEKLKLRGTGFVRTHRSYLVNLLWVEYIGEEEIGLKEGIGKIPISKRNRPEVITQYEQYYNK